MNYDIIDFMSLTFEEVEHIAELARLELADDEKEHYRQQLSAVLDYFKDLQSVDTSHISAKFSLIPQARLRPDESAASLTPEALFKNAPQAEGGQFRVPPVLDYDEG
jgi:aspartyl-tRNA(Asn)/glutamyl-tRNA(Gln) amidotransferase subunit C